MLIIDAGSCGAQSDHVIDLTGPAPEVVRKGKGPVGPFRH